SRAFELSRDIAAYQVAQPIDRGVGDSVVGAVAARLPRHQAALGQQRQVPRDVGRGVAAQLRQLTDVAFLLPQQVEDLQTRRLGQGLEVRRNLRQGLVR